MTQKLQGLIHIDGSSVVDPGCLSRIRIFSIPDPRSTSKNLSILTQKIVSKLSEYDPGCSSRIQILIFYPSRIPDSGQDPGVKKRHRLPDPGSATLGGSVAVVLLNLCNQAKDLERGGGVLTYIFNGLLYQEHKLGGIVFYILCTSMVSSSTVPAPTKSPMSEWTF